MSDRQYVQIVYEMTRLLTWHFEDTTAAAQSLTLTMNETTEALKIFADAFDDSRGE